MAKNVRFKDFTLNRPDIKFRIGEQNFDAVAALNADLIQGLADVAGEFSSVEESGSFDPSKLKTYVVAMVDICDSILVPESAERFRELAPRLDIQEQLIPLLYWLLEAYGLRPTEVSSDSSTSSLSATDGTTSEDGALSLVSESES